ncbi:MAG: penicillin-binding protein 2 [Actinomycetota bacterium]|nr:MAG: penicillin-binding protein 2 [Actinomycetota bacterium]
MSTTTPPRRPAPARRPAPSRRTAATGRVAPTELRAAPPRRTPPRRTSPRPATAGGTLRRPPRRLRTGSPRRRASMALVVILVFLTIFAGRLLELQAVRGEALAGAALGQRLRTVDLPAGRGTIRDAAGTALAVTVDAVNITADQTQVRDPQAAAAALAPVLGIDAAILADRLTGTRRFVYLKKEATPAQWADVRALGQPGIFSEPSTKRTYPAGELAANLIGFVGADGKGLGGLEYGLQSELAGKDGSRTYERSAGGGEIPTADDSEIAAQPGLDVNLTINGDIQWVAQQALAQKVKQSHADSGTAVVMNPRTGEILALATVPTFDPNQPAEAAVADRGNRALSDVFEPGSTSKVMSLAAVIEEGKADAGTVFDIPAKLAVGGATFGDDFNHGDIKLTLNGILAKSSNIGTIEATRLIGQDTLYRYLKAFGVGEPTGLRFPGEARGYVPPTSAWSATSFPTISFGQGLSVNAVQAASIYATIANDGVRVQPSLVRSYVAADGSTTPVAAPTSTRVVSAQTATTMRRMLETVITNGTAPLAKIDGYRVAGKTGTAQRVNPNGRGYDGYVASFIGMAPADDPQLVVAVSINNPQTSHYGGTLAAPVFAQIMTSALQTLHLPPTGTVASPLKVTPDGR